jgi:hypothetical protein
MDGQKETEEAMRHTFAVRVYVGSSTNRNRLHLLDQARRLVDLRGQFIKKRDQTNDRFARRGYLRFPFGTRASAKRFQRDVASLGSDHHPPNA